MIRGYDVEYDPYIDLYRVDKEGSKNSVKRDKGLYCYCKAVQVNNVFFLCRHKKMVIQKFYANKKFKRLFNIGR